MQTWMQMQVQSDAQSSHFRCFQATSETSPWPFSSRFQSSRSPACGRSPSGQFQMTRRFLSLKEWLFAALGHDSSHCNGGYFQHGSRRGFEQPVIVIMLQSASDAWREQLTMISVLRTCTPY
jgi:hypothetical protein